MKDLPKTKDLILNFKNGWLDILFDNVENRNALKDNLIEELFIVFDLIRNDKRVRGVLLRGNGGVFCSGADLKEMKEITSAGESAKQKAFDLSMTIGNLLSTINLPIFPSVKIVLLANCMLLRVILSLRYLVVSLFFASKWLIDISLIL